MYEITKRFIESLGSKAPRGFWTTGFLVQLFYPKLALQKIIFFLRILSFPLLFNYKQVQAILSCALFEFNPCHKN